MGGMGYLPISNGFDFPTFNRSNDSSIYPLSFHTLGHSFALFCTPQKINSFIFKRFRILRQKTQPPRVGEGGQISLPASPGPGKFDPVKVALSMRSTGHATPVTSRNYPFDQKPAGLVRTGVGQSRPKMEV